MPATASAIRRTGPVSHGHPHRGPSEDDEEQEGLELPVEPDEGTPLMPDEEGEVQVPS
ncbi:hypothetical protein [Polaromonas sp.]|jgi:hypothetical protein|uniref:hypothetical protein n=1 Tax=Polaromonas sp. TaxID=1869339 RepID=UPI001D73D7F2|nr:hypothetical protein [Polaromonas sp.]MBT9476222.1 hypothetical protein [Polaromonas sp.]